MDKMLEKLIESIFSKVGETLVDFGMETVNGKDSKSVLETLKRNLNRLRARACDINQEIKNGEKSCKKKRKREVEEWLEEIQAIDSEFRELEMEKEGFINWVFGGDQATELNARVVELVNQSQQFGELLLDAYETKGEPLLTTELFGEAFEKNVEKIWKLLVNDKIPIVGIYGMGGVGKTTLAKHIHNLFLEKTKHHVYWVTVSGDFSIKKLQDDIAKVVGINLTTEDDEDKRAASLNGALSQIKDFVLILDDVWDNISLIRVGITHHLEGCRLIITTRSSEVCRRIGCHEIISVQTLFAEEAWNLFKEILGQETILSQEVEEIAKSVAKECHGLPMGIVTLAGSMKGVTNIHVWKNTFTELSESLLGQDEMEDKVFGVLKYSFDRLDPNYKREDIRNGYTKLQLCFLYCSLYPEDYNIGKDKLISKFISEKLIDHRTRREAKFDKGHAILDKLVKACLLESIKLYNGRDGVKMHDLVRDMALRITRDNPKFKVLARLSLREFPCEEEYWTKDIEKMSLMENKIREIPEGMSPNCPKLSTLLLNSNKDLTFIPDSFFSLMCGLSVLDLSFTGISVLPNSVGDLESLNALIVEGCPKLVSVPNLKKLKALEELELTYNEIEEVPQGMENLVNLKYLRLQYMPKLKMLPKGLLPRFKYLQYLLLPFNIQVDVEEIKSLKQLEKLSCRVKDVYDFNCITRQSDEGYCITSSFEIVIGTEYMILKQSEQSPAAEIDGKRVIVCSCDLVNGEGNEVSLVAQDIQNLELYSCKGLNNCFSDDLERLGCTPTSIKKLKISRSEEIECMWTTTSNCEFNSLEEIHLYGLPNLMGVVDVAVEPPPPIGLFSSLKLLALRGCHKIKNLGLGLLLDNLQNLESIDIGWCDEIEELILVPDEGRGGVVSLPKLKYLHLTCMPKLKSVCEAKMDCSSIRTFSFLSCPEVKKLPFLFHQSSADGQSYFPPPTLENIRTHHLEDKEWWESLEWDHPTHKDIYRPFLNFDI